MFLLASCGGGGGGGGGGGQGALSVELAFTPGNENVTVDLVKKGPLVQLLNISTYQLTAIDSADEEMRTEGDRLAERTFNGSILRGLTNDRNYTFSLRVFYFPIGSAELSNLSLRIDYARVNAENIRAARGITIGINTDGDYLADLVDGDDDNDHVMDSEDTGAYNGRPCRLFVDCDGDSIEDDKDLGEVNGVKCYLSPDCDNDTILDNLDSGELMGVKCYLSTDCDRDSVADGEDLGEYDGRECRLFSDCDNDTLLDGEDNCPVIASSDQADGDDDGAGDLCDLDLDGDGLIEIGTAAELDAVRWALDGSGRRLSEGATLDQTGCGNGADRTACGGYELIGDISLANYGDGSGWAPLGNDTDLGTSGCQGTRFSGVFDGNGFVVRDLDISRSGEDCVGLFGHLAAGTVIRNLTVRADSVIGRNNVGGLVGRGRGAKIASSCSVVGEVRGSDSVAGLVGDGRGEGGGRGAEIVSSCSVAGEVRGGQYVGGLIGDGRGGKIVSSYSVAGEVRGDQYVGGLVGWGENAEVVSSYSVAREVRSQFYVGGLMGLTWNAEIVSSYSVAGRVRGSFFIGGLAAASSPDVDVDSSYWYTTVALANNGKGENKTLTDLRMPTNDNAYDMGSIYADWADGADISGGAEVEDITIYCDEDLSGTIETDEVRNGSVTGESDNRIWDFGDSSDYPAIRCTPGELDDQRGWWFINTTTNQLQLNQVRLDRLTSP